MKFASGRYRPETVTAAVGVLLRRPAVWLVGIALLVQIGLLVSALNNGHRSSDSENNIPDYEPGGKKLWSVRDELALAFERDQPDSSIQRLHLDFVKISESRGRTVILLDDLSSKSGNDAAAFKEIPLAGFIQFLKTFKRVQWVSLRSEQLAVLPSDFFNQMPQLRGIEFTGDELTGEDIRLLSRLKKIEHLTLQASWCDHGLQQLAALPNLKSLHLRTLSFKRTKLGGVTATRRFISVQDIASLKGFPNLEELAIEDNGELFNYAFMTGLAEDNRGHYEKVVGALKLSSTLKSVYVGRLKRPHGDELLEKMAGDLPKLSVHPATYDSSMADWVTLGNLATVLGLGVLTMHLVTCNSAAQNCLLNGASQAHLKVYLTGAALFLLLPTATILLRTHAHWLPVITFQVSLFAFVTLFGGLGSGTVNAAGGTAQWWRWLSAPLVFSVTGLIIFVWLGKGPYGASVAKYFCGHFPLLCQFSFAAAIVMLASHLPSFLNLHRLWAESGRSPATTWAELQGTLKAQQVLHQQNVKTDSAQESGQEHLGDAWLARLNSTAEAFRKNPHSAVVRCRLWLAAFTSMSIPRAIFMAVVIWPLFGLWPLFYELFTVGPSALADASHLTMVIGIVSILGSFMVFMQWYVRRAMFETEILRPVSRSVWRDTVLQSMLFATGLITLIAWGQAHLFRLIAGQHLPLSWVTLSLLSVFAATMLATGLNLWALVQRNVVAAAALVLATLAAFVPLLFTAMPELDGSSNFQVWLVIVVSEGIIGGLILATAWNKWGRLELGNR